MKLKDALLFLAAIEDVEDELDALEKGEEFELPAKLHIRVNRRRLTLTLVAKAEE